jgi:hypothetical protein
MVLNTGYASGTVQVSSVTQTNCTWVFAIRKQQTGDGISTETWYCVSAGASPGTTITITYASAVTRRTAVVQQYSSAFASSPLDVSASTSATLGGGTATSIASGTTGATTQASEAWVFSTYALETDGDGGATPTLSSPSNSFSIIQQVTGNQSGQAGWSGGYMDRVVSATASSVSATVTAATGYSGYVSTMCCFKFASSGKRLLPILDVGKECLIGPRA